MTPLTISFATGNKNKLREVQQILGDEYSSRFVLESVDIDLPELQGLPEDIAKLKAAEAASRTGCGVVVEDTSLCFNALGGLPGPYVKWFLGNVGPGGLEKMLKGFEDKTAYAQCIFAYCSGPGAETLVFVGQTPGRIVEPRGPTDFGWDPIFEPDGFDQTYAEMDKTIKNTISHRYKALDKFRSYLLEITEPASNKS
eukprot:CAMPEP_0196579802 /NCGR_PEP_ID=MMETSP1081-20130531/24840_1 /TAXON_ID=36882 /ORGANISM="Pyramimonas amylifera, Strain CCMP720" /LENGTH=197 /DNA_ID=CAMNT_0041899495 /DNA_START=166 /DNA_END=759 /DNA_ORIENTATION=+